MASGERWTRDQLLVALNVYARLKFGQFHSRNPVIVDVANRLGRTPDALAMKLCNFASLDPVERARGVVGLEGASALDRSLWIEFEADREVIVVAGEAQLAQLFGA